MRIILATNNKNKVLELKNKIKKTVYSLKDIGINIDIVEDGNTLCENAFIKAKAIAKLLPNDIIIADDTGLFVKSLNNEPGVYSARYAGDGCSSEDNINKLLENLKSKSERSAYFETAIVVYKAGEYHHFNGRLDGEILSERVGDLGFGYDSIFYCIELKKSLAQLSKQEKNMISHRAKAIEAVLNSKLF